MSGEIFCVRDGSGSELRDITFQQVFGKKIRGTCDSCGVTAFGDIGIARIVLNDEEGVCVGIVVGDEFHPVAQVPWSRVKKQ